MKLSVSLEIDDALLGKQLSLLAKHFGFDIGPLVEPHAADVEEEEVQETTTVEPVVETTTTAEPTTPEPTPVDPPKKRRRRTKAQIEADNAAEQSVSEPVVGTTPTPEVVTVPETEPAAEVEDTPVEALESAKQWTEELLSKQTSIKFPSPNDFLREAYGKDRVKAKQVCADFLEEIRASDSARNVAVLADLNDDERQMLCQRIVDAGIADLPE